MVSEAEAVHHLQQSNSVQTDTTNSHPQQSNNISTDGNLQVASPARSITSINIGSHGSACTSPHMDDSLLTVYTGNDPREPNPLNNTLHTVSETIPMGIPPPDYNTAINLQPQRDIRDMERLRNTILSVHNGSIYFHRRSFDFCQPSNQRRSHDRYIPRRSESFLRR